MPTSLALWLEAPRRLRWRDEPLGPPGEGELLVRSRWGAISVGAELALFRGEMGPTESLYPRMSGYENLAVVEEVGRGVTRGLVGREVVAWYGHRSRALVRRDRVIPVPAGLRDRPASLLAVLAADVEQAIVRAAPRPDDAILVFGAGALGLLCLDRLAGLKHRELLAVEASAHRRALARAFGANRTHADLDRLPRHAATLAFDCSGSASDFGPLLEHLAPLGRLALLSDPDAAPRALTPTFFDRELQAFASSDSRTLARDGRRFLTRLDAPRLDRLSRLFEQQVAFELLPELFAALADAASRPIKVLVDYGP